MKLTNPISIVVTHSKTWFVGALIVAVVAVSTSSYAARRSTPNVTKDAAGLYGTTSHVEDCQTCDQSVCNSKCADLGSCYSYSYSTTNNSCSITCITSSGNKNNFDYDCSND